MNPCCPYKDCKGFLHRQHSGRRMYLICSKNKKHRVAINTALQRESYTDE